MKKVFQNRIEAVDWIAGYVENEGQFEVLREQLNYNYIYTGELFLDIDLEEAPAEVVTLNKERK